MANTNHKWEDNGLQFARLIAELNAAGVFQDKKVMKDLKDSMELSENDIMILVDRAEADFEKAKA